MLGLRADTYQFNTNGEGQYEFFADLSTRTLQTVRVGENAGKISKGVANAFVGYESGRQNNNGSFGVFVGFHAGAINTNGSYNTYVGAFSGEQNNRGDFNTFVGYQSGQLNKDGSQCTAVGAFAMRENTTGNKNVAVGNRAGERILDGDNNTMVGTEAGQDIRSGNNNTITGYRAGRGSFRNNENTYVGAFAGYSNSQGDGNAFIGYKAGEYLTLGSFNVAVGAYALQKASVGDCNIAIGAFAGENITGSGNVLVGTGAATSNTEGNQNTILGADAGHNATGDDNVYIGRNAAYSLEGNQNVVIGAFAYQDFRSTGSVAIGYKVGNRTFDRGNCNIFIGTGADSFIDNTSYAIAIGPQNTRAYIHSISVGEDILNGGINSVSMGYDINSDADQCIILGNAIDISSVQVFNDPLNYRFPVNATEAARLFYLTPYYTDTLFLNNTSNEIAIARIDNSNLYDTGNNTLPGITQPDQINLQNTFAYALFYHSKAIPYTQENLSNLPPFTYSDYLLDNTNQNLRTTNFNKNTLSIETTGVFSLSNYPTTNAQPIFFNGFALPFLNNSNIPISSNLVPITTPRFALAFAIPRRHALFQSESTVYDIPFQTPTPINPASNLSPQAEETATVPSTDWQQSTYLTTPPIYGQLSNLTYTLYPEAYFACNDAFILDTINRFNYDSSTYRFIDPSLPSTVLFNQIQAIHITSNIFLHPTQPTIIDRSFIHPTPASNTAPVTITNLDPTRVNLYYNNTLTTTPITIPHQDLNLRLTLQDPNQQPINGLQVTLYDTTITIPYIYTSNIQSYPLTSNILFEIPPFTLESYPIPIENHPNTYIIKRPTYGTLTLSPPTYQPTTLNMDQDTFQLLIQYSPANATYFTITAQTSNAYQSLRLNRMQQPVRQDPLQETTTITTQTITIPFFTQLTSNVSYTNPPNNQTPYTLTFTVPTDLNYDQIIGYIATCNITLQSTYTQIPTNPDPAHLPSPSNLWDVNGRDFYIYNPYPPIASNLKYQITSPNTPFQTTQSTYLPASNIEIAINTQNLNRYYYKTQTQTTQEYYAKASNLAISYSNQILNYQIHDYYTHHIYTSNVPLPLIPPSSNITLIPTTPTLIQTNTITTTTITSNINQYIPAIPLQRSTIYQHDAPYQIDRSRTSNNLVFLLKNQGPTNHFHQSNINQEEVFLWNTSPTLPESIVTSNIYFTNNRQLQVRYFQNATNPPQNLTSPDSITFVNQIDTTNFDFQFDNSIPLLNIAIEYTCNVSFYKLESGNKVITLDYLQNIDTVRPIHGISYSNNPIIHYVNFNNNYTQPIRPLTQTIQTTYTRTHDLTHNIAPSFLPTTTYLTSNELFYASPTITNATYQIQTMTNDITLFRNNIPLNPLDTFTQSEINQYQITVSNSNTLQTSDFTVSRPDATPQTLTLTTFVHPIYPPTSQTSSNLFISLQDTLLSQTTGPLYQFLNTPDMELRITTPPSHGFIASNFIPENVFTHSNNLNNTYQYIPHTPMALSNDTFQAYFSYSNTVSDTYTFTVKNYWSRWSELYTKHQTYYTSNLPRSQGLIEDNLHWSPSTITTNLPEERSNVTLTLLNYTIPTDIQYVPFQTRPYFTQSNITFTLDHHGYTYLTPLLTTVNDPSQSLIFFITTPPNINTGLLLTHDQTAPTFTTQDILNNQTYYHHIGNNTSNDSMQLRVGTSYLDMSSNILTVQFNISPRPALTTNTYDYVYGTDPTVYYPLNTSKLNITSGFLNAYQRCNIDLFKLDNATYTPTTVLSANDISTNTIFYRPNSNFFSSGINANEPMSFEFTLNTATSNAPPSPLTKYPNYTNTFAQNWFSKYNTYESINTLQSELTSNQSISYTRFVNTASNISFNRKKCEFQVEFQPFQPPFNNTQYIDFIKTFYFTFDLLDLSDQPIASVEFTHDTITLTTDQINYQIQTPITFNSTTWNAFSLINYDNLNNSYVTLSINDINYTEGLDLPNFSLSNLKQIKLDVPIYHPFNYYNLTQTSNLTQTTNVYYNFTHFNTQMRFRNFNIFLGTYDVEEVLIAGSSEKDIYNIIIGNQLDIRGLNNICLGKNFRTSGRGSVILGSDIGVQFDSSGEQIQAFNEIFNSIVISNNSFRNSKVRDVISIGNDILNDITENIEPFLAKKPVLVGNNIDRTKLDYHINFQNTFLKTTVDTPQIYLGLENEHVCVGYNTNAKINNPYQLHVNGGAEFLGDTKQQKNTLITQKHLFGFTTPSSTSHQATFQVSWTNQQSTDTYIFVLRAKYYITGTDPTATTPPYGYRRFELFITPMNDPINNKPNRVSDLEVASFSSPTLTNLTHTVTRHTPTSTNLTFSFTTPTVLPFEHALELECTYKTQLGAITIAQL